MAVLTNDVDLKEASIEELESLHALEAAAGGESLSKGSSGEPVEAAIDPVLEIEAMIGLAVGMLAPMLPYLPAIYTDDAIKRLAGAYVPVAEKYGWNVGGGIFEAYGAEILLAVTALPMLKATRDAHKAYREQEAYIAQEHAKEAAKRSALQDVEGGVSANQ